MMRGIAAALAEPIVQQAVGQLPWGRITVLLDKLDTLEARSWYASTAVEYGWSRNVAWHLGYEDVTANSSCAAIPSGAGQGVAGRNEILGRGRSPLL